jgi:glycosyltransferase involved in cell wall biosynthesis
LKILVHDFSGHPFQAQLSRELSRRGHDITHSYCAAYTGGKGNLQAEPGETLVFDPITIGESIAKLNFVKRSIQELKIGFQLIKQVRRVKPQVVMFSTTPVPSLVVIAFYLMVRRIPWVLWHQDVQAIAIRSFAGNQLPKAFLVAAKLIEWGERWGSRRAKAVVVIADSFVDVHREWGTADKVTVIPNWAPLDEIVPVERDNAWAKEQGVNDVATLLYSGTLGMKHNPELLPRVAKAVIDGGTPIRLVVVNEGPAAPVVQAEADRLGVPLTLLPFQPYDRLPEVLGSGDILMVLLEQSAGAFSVPSKTLSYLCAGRPILGMMPAENLASVLVEQTGGCVLRPEEAAVPAAAAWIREVLADPERAAKIGAASRTLAEREFELGSCADRFEAILIGAGTR